MPNNSSAQKPLALTGIRVLEIGTGPALAYAGKLLADFGAEVIKLEDEAGDALRHFPPVLETNRTETQSALNAWLNTNKRSATLRSNSPQETAWLARLAQSCDLVLDARALTERFEKINSVY